jgi:hypothetical protein
MPMNIGLLIECQRIFDFADANEYWALVGANEYWAFGMPRMIRLNENWAF